MLEKSGRSEGVATPFGQQRPVSALRRRSSHRVDRLQTPAPFTLLAQRIDARPPGTTSNSDLGLSQAGQSRSPRSARQRQPSGSLSGHAGIPMVVICRCAVRGG